MTREINIYIYIKERQIDQLLSELYIEVVKKKKCDEIKLQEKGEE
jgi:hypothetical protein